MMSLRKRGTVGLSDAQRSSVRALLERPLFELVPLRDAVARAEALPAGASTTVTASPSHGIESTVELCEALIDRGFPATPHLAAHMIRDRAHLERLLDRCRVAGMRDVFIVGGDAKEPGEYRDGVSLLRAMEDAGHPFTEIGVPGYPEGHPFVPDDALLASLRAKQPHATYMTTQMTFDGGAIAGWIDRMRTSGIGLPVNVGLPGTVEIRRLLRVAARIGVGGSVGYLRKNRQIIGLVFRRSFSPERLLWALAPAVVDPAADIRRLHLFTFNQVETTVAWQRRVLDELGP